MGRNAPISNLSLTEINELFTAAPLEELSSFIKKCAKDERAGVRALVLRAQRRLAAEQRRLDEFKSRCSLERRLAESFFQRVAGVDEAGRGALAGPLVAAAVILPSDLSPFIDIKDSKMLTPEERDLAFVVISKHAVCSSVVVIGSDEIDRTGIAPANRTALEEATRQLSPVPDYLIVDAFSIRVEMPSLALIKGDAVSVSVAAASVVAKVTRDRLMKELDQRHPGYGFAVNKGYGTPDHLSAIELQGPCEIHRRTFYPVSSYGSGS